jgi:hypothetical protein
VASIRAAAPSAMAEHSRRTNSRAGLLYTAMSNLQQAGQREPLDPIRF